MMPNQPTETSIPIGEWSIGPLKAYQDQATAGVKELLQAEIRRIDADIKQLNILLDERSITQEKAVAAALSATREAITKSETATEKRFESVNEFRAALSDASKEQLTRTEYNAAHIALIDKIDDMKVRLTTFEGINAGSQLNKADIYRAVGLGVGILGFILSIIVLVANNVF